MGHDITLRICNVGAMFYSGAVLPCGFSTGTFAMFQVAWWWLCNLACYYTCEDSSVDFAKVLAVCQVNQFRSGPATLIQCLASNWDFMSSHAWNTSFAHAVQAVRSPCRYACGCWDMSGNAICRCPARSRASCSNELKRTINIIVHPSIPLDSLVLATGRAVAEQRTCFLNHLSGGCAVCATIWNADEIFDVFVI